jgi:hypothetical protein
MTMPNETLWNVLEFIPRTEVVAVILASRKLKDVVGCNTTIAPRRRIAALTFCDNSEFHLATTDSERTLQSYTFPIKAAVEVLKRCVIDSAQ